MGAAKLGFMETVFHRIITVEEEESMKHLESINSFFSGYARYNDMFDKTHTYNFGFEVVSVLSQKRFCDIRW